jgi:hypothetical protein
MKAIGKKQQTSGKGLGIKQNTGSNSLGVKGVYFRNNMIMPKGEPLQITGIINKSNTPSTEFMAKGLKGRMTK